MNPKYDVDDSQVGRGWDENAEVWERHVRAGYDTCGGGRWRISLARSVLPDFRIEAIAEPRPTEEACQVDPRASTYNAVAVC